MVISGEEAQALLARIRDHVVNTKREPTSEELERFYLEAAQQVGVSHAA
jgi:hypothetical protein